MAGTFWLVDGTALAYRSHFAFISNPLTNAKGQETSATFGYVRGLFDILRKEKVDGMAVAFDVSRETFRKELYKEYKATREKAPEEMTAQFPWIKEITEALGIPMLEREGFEADDLIAAATKRALAEGFDVKIVTGDKDMLQLVSDRVHVWDLGKKTGPLEIDPAGVRELFGVGPDRIIDLLGLMGDTSDNVPGVKGIGEKTARKLLEEFGTLEEVLAHAPERKGKKTYDSLVEQADAARLSKRLVTLRTDLDVDLPPLRKRDSTRLRELFLELDFNALLKEVVGEAGERTSDEGYVTARGGAELDALRRKLAGFFVIDTETSSLDPFSARIVGMSFSWDDGKAAYVPWSDEARSTLKPLLEDPALRKGAQNAKFDLQVLRTHGIEVMGLEFDTMVASYLLDPGRGTHNLDALALRYLNVRKTATEELIGKGASAISMADVPEEKVARYAAEDADVTYRLVDVFRPQLEADGLMPLFRDVEMPLVRVLLDMERAGVRVDVPYLKQLSREFEDVAHKVEREIREIAGEEVNLNSPKQLGPLLFEKLEIQKGTGRRPKRTRTGAYSTDADTLEAFAAHPIVAKLLDYREVTKLKSTYVDALPGMVHPSDGRIHSSFNQTVAATGRLSSENPNLQNIPIRTEIGRRIRRAFVAEEGNRLLSADYSQIELRLMAHLSGDPGLCEVYRRKGDVHAETAARMFKLPLGEVTRDQRSSAKAINFGILYGMGPTRLARDLKISMDEARDFLDRYFGEFPGVRDFQRRAVEKARHEGYVTTLLGRRRAIPEIVSDEPGVRANAENMAKNTPVQGTAADLIKVAMVKIHARLARERFRARMILQVHDELVFEAPAEEIDRLAPLVRGEMEGALALDVPIVADLGVGRDWLEAHE
ncbi:MAG TPA: DNA polymerase I [Planctomycetota bacterium]|nr:DNA polymerase I [Planctomycetota bacterium]